MQLAPSLSLSPVVKHYMLLETKEDLHLNYRLFSAGNPGLVFHFKQPMRLYEGDQLNGSMYNVGFFLFYLYFIK
jgi:hypothetical protein